MVDAKAMSNEELIKTTRAWIAEEKAMALRSVILIGEIQWRRLPARCGMATEAFAEKILGLSSDQFWKRSQVARTITAFPEMRRMLESGETTVSAVALVAPKITQANQDILIEGMRGKSKRDVKALVDRVAFDGSVLPERTEVEVTLKFKVEEMKVLERLREVLMAAGKTPSMSEAILKAAALLVEKRDPVRVAERALKRLAEKAPAPAPAQVLAVETQAQAMTPTPAPAQVRAEDRAEQGRGLAAFSKASSLDSSRAPAPAQGAPVSCPRTAIPAIARHQVMLRDQGQCTFRYHDSSRCAERGIVEIDHVVPVSLGGAHDVSNLRLLCRYHNQHMGYLILGEAKMAPHALPARWRSSS